MWEGIRQQNELTAQLCFIVGDIAQVRGNARKVERLREILNQPATHGFTDLSTFQSMPLPLDPCVQVSVAHLSPLRGKKGWDSWVGLTMETKLC